MPTTSLKTAARRYALAATIGVGAFVAAPSAASAAGTNACDASALQLSLLGGAALDPIHANPGYSPCVTADGTLIQIPELLGLVGVDAVTATTRNTANVNAESTARVAGLKVGTGPIVGQLTGALLDGPDSVVNQITSGLAPVLGPLGLQVITDNLLSSVQSTLGGVLTNVLPSVLEAGVIEAQARAVCVAGNPRLSGNSQIADLKVLGTAVDVNGAANRLLTLDTRAIKLGELLSLNDLLKAVKFDQNGVVGVLVGILAGQGITNVYDLTQANDGVVGLVNALLFPLQPLLAPLGLGNVGQIVNTVTGTLQPLLNSVEINIPENLLNARVTPNAQAIVGDQLTQQALTLSVSLLNQPILAGTIAQARVGAGAPGCVPPTTGPGVKDPDKYTSPEAEAYLQCSSRDVDMIDVYGTGGRTYIQGVAQRKYVGKTATIYLAHGKKKVGTVKVGEDGLFSTKVALPPKKIRTTNKARYYAVVEGRRTRALKFARRMETRSLTATSSSVTFRGRVVGPLQKRQQAVTIKQRLGCKTYKTVGTAKPDSKGNFTVKIKAPAGDGAVIYRAQTKVGKKRNAKRLSPTFTLPRVVGLR